MALNIELAEQVLEQITTHPETHNQGHYRHVNCNTTMCIAGWAADLAGGEWITAGNGQATSRLVAEPDDPRSHRFDFAIWERDDDEPKNVTAVSAHDRGQRVLGLTTKRADQLFEDQPNAAAIEMLRRTIRSAKAYRARRGDA